MVVINSYSLNVVGCLSIDQQLIDLCATDKSQILFNFTFSINSLLVLLFLLCFIIQGSILAFFQTRQPGKDVRKDTCPDIILLAHSKLCNNQNTVRYIYRLYIA